MSLLILMPGRDTAVLEETLRAGAPELELEVWPEVGDPAAVEMAVVWNHPQGELLRYPRLEVVCSYGAGVDHLLRDPELPTGAEIVRVVDPQLVRDMVEYVVGAVISWRRDLATYRCDQAERRWQPREYDRSRRALVLGAGELGGAVARGLAAVGFDAVCWATSAGDRRGVPTISGRDALESALAAADATVCLLPLTPATEGLFDASLLATMKPGSLLVNVGRGHHLVESDLVAALDRGRPAAAWLDVFDTEPLPAASPLWVNPAVTITPHVASLTDPRSVAGLILDVWRRHRVGEPLPHRVDPARGY